MNHIIFILVFILSFVSFDAIAQNAPLWVDMLVSFVVAYSVTKKDDYDA